MAVSERRTRYWEWKCDNPSCGVVGRQFTRDERPPEWLSAKVTGQSVKAFCSTACADAWWRSVLTDGLPREDVPEAADAG